MDSVLEKITLYDILGYLLPGSVLILLILYAIEETGTYDVWSLLSDSQGFVYFVFFLISYLIGIALSELMTLVWRIVGRIFKIGKEGIEKADNIAVFHRINQFAKVKVSKRVESQHSDQVVRALKRSGIEDGETEIMDCVKDGTFRQTYMQYMYGYIQKNETYKRIHNYASAYVLYKNVAGALIIGFAFIQYCSRDSGLWIGFMPFLILSIIFIIRAVRFQNKKYDYTIMWFLESFNH